MYKNLVTLSFALNQCLFGINKGALASQNKKNIPMGLSSRVPSSTTLNVKVEDTAPLINNPQEKDY